MAVRDGRAESVTIENVLSFAARLDATVDVPGLGSVRYDMAYGGNFYAILPLADLDIPVDRAFTDRILTAGLDIMAAINATDRPKHPIDPAISGYKHVQFTAPGVDGSDSRNCTRGVSWTWASTSSTSRCWAPGSPADSCAPNESAPWYPRSPAGRGSPAWPSTSSTRPTRSPRGSCCENPVQINFGRPFSASVLAGRIRAGQWHDRQP